METINKYNKWNESDILFVKENCKKLTISQIASHLNRSPKGVERIGHINGFTFSDRRKWSLNEEQFILNNSTKPVILIAKDLNRNVDMLKKKMKSMNLPPIRLTKKWSNCEHDFIKKNEHLSRKELASALNISVGMASAKRNELGIKDKFRNADRKNKTSIICRICKIEFPKTKEFFYFDKNDILTHSRCKKCEVIGVQKRKRSSLDSHFMVMLNSIKSRYRHGKKFKEFTPSDIDLEFLNNMYLKQRGKCAITGIIMESTYGNGRNGRSVSIDRIDSSKGYTKDNVQFVCDWANISKGILSQEDYKSFIIKAYNCLILRNDE